MKLPIADPVCAGGFAEECCRLPVASALLAVEQTGGLLYRRLATCDVAAPADCQSAIQQTASLRYKDGRRRAFTLIELMVVVAIIGLVAAMGLPSIFKALQKEGMRKAVSDVEGVCFSAREQAIIFNKPVAVTFIPHDRKFGVDGATGTAGADGTVVNTHSGRAVMATLPEGVEMAWAGHLPEGLYHVGLG